MSKIDHALEKRNVSPPLGKLALNWLDAFLAHRGPALNEIYFLGSDRVNAMAASIRR